MLHRLLLNLYPREFQAVFGAEMRKILAAEGGTPRELGALLVGAGMEWAVKFWCAISSSNGYLSDYPLYDSYRMRPAGVTWEQFYRGIERKRLCS